MRTCEASSTRPRFAQRPAHARHMCRGVSSASPAACDARTHSNQRASASSEQPTSICSSHAPPRPQSMPNATRRLRNSARLRRQVESRRQRSAGTGSAVGGRFLSVRTLRRLLMAKRHSARSIRSTLPARPSAENFGRCRGDGGPCHSRTAHRATPRFSRAHGDAFHEHTETLRLRVLVKTAMPSDHHSANGRDLRFRD